MKNILVTGGTGTLGKEVVRQLLRLHYNICVLSSRENPSLQANCNVIHGDLAGNKNLTQATKNIDAIIHCASNSRDAYNVDFKGTQNLLRAVTAKEKCHFIYISIVGIDKSEYSYYQTKLKVEKLIAESGIPFSILRATQFHDFVLRIVKSFEKHDKTIFISEGMKFQSIDVTEVATKLVELAATAPLQLLPDMGGPQVLSIEEIVQTYLDVNALNYKIVFTKPKTERDKLFSSGINLCPENDFGKITWRQFLQRR